MITTPSGSKVQKDSTRNRPAILVLRSPLRRETLSLSLPRLRKEKIMLLVIDDDPSFLESAESLDGEQGVLFARDAEHAKALIGVLGRTFSMALIDLDLPGQDGFSLILEMRRMLPDLPIIAISGTFHRNVLESAKVIGAQEALSKPIGPEWFDAIARVRARASRPE